MAVEEEVRTVREAVGVFNRPEELQGAIDELLSSGFYRAELSLLASAHAVEAKLDHRYEKVSSLADDPTVPRDILTICKSRWIVEACCYGCVPGTARTKNAPSEFSESTRQWVPTFTHCLRIISRERACPLAAHLDLDILHLAQQNDLRRSRFFNAIMPMDLTIRGIDHRCVA